MVTEPVRPLESVIQTLDTLEIIAGLYNVVDALAFLHDKVCCLDKNLTSMGHIERVPACPLRF